MVTVAESKRAGRLLKSRLRDVIPAGAKNLFRSFSGRRNRFFNRFGMAGSASHRLAVCVLALIGCLLAGGLAAPAVGIAEQKSAPIVLPSRISPQAQQLLNRTIQALGGEAFLHYKARSSTGHVFAISRGQTAGFAPFKSTFEPPDKRRFSYGKGKPVVLINNGDQAWELDRLGRTHQNPRQVRNWKIANRYSLDNLLRYRIHASGVLILTHGVDFVDNQPVEVVDIIDSRNIQVRLYIHRSTFLPVRITYRVQNPNTQEWEDYADDYSDYQKFQGIATPMHVTRFLDGERIAELFRESVNYNQTIPPDYFEPPR